MSERENDTILKISHAHKFYNRGRSNELHVMDDIDLSLPASGMVAIFGQSGCGKTTLLNAVGGLDAIASGSIELFGENMAGDTDTLRNKYIGYIFQNYNLNVNETVFDNVADALRLCGMSDPDEIRTRVLASLRNVGMDKYKNRTPDTLSGGQQQRVAIARALVKNPAVILADEPTGNLDEANTVLVMDILKEISKTHLVLLVTHEANLVDFYCDRVIKIVDGRIVDDRTNAEANGYVARDKNDIYLGELEKREEVVSGVTLTCYGTAETPVKLRIVTSGGRTYLVCDSPDVRILDEHSEIKLREGVFVESARPENGQAAAGRTLDMSALTPIEGHHFGRLFRTRNALSSAWQDNFAKKQKKGTKLLRFTLFLLAVVMVFMTAVSAVSIRSLVNVYREHDANLFFLKLEPGKDYSAVMNAPASSGIDASWLTGSSIAYAKRDVTFDTAAFVTARSEVLYGSCYVADAALFADAPVAAGTKELKDVNDVLITTAFGDELIKSSTVAYIDSYEDLIGLICPAYGMFSQSRVVGVVRSDEKLMLEDGLRFADEVLYQTVNLQNSLGLAAQSKQKVWKESVAPGEMVVLNGCFEAGEVVRLLGRDFKVSHSDMSSTYTRLADYYRFYLERTGMVINDPESYVESGDPSKTKEQKLCEWVFEVFPQGETFRDYCRLLVENYVPWNGNSEMMQELWYYAETGDPAMYLTLLQYLAGQSTGLDNGVYPMLLDGELYPLYGAYLSHKETGAWPAALAAGKVERDSYYMAVETAYLEGASGYKQYMNEHESKFSMNVGYVISDEDYKALAGSAGTTDERLLVYAFNVYEDPWAPDGVTYQNHMVIHASDPKAASAYLTEHFSDKLVTPDMIFEETLAAERGEIIASAVAILVVLALMCLCVFFIMRSSFMSRVREVGILRAIGVTKKNLVFRFTVETLLLISMTILIGFIFSSVLIIYLSGGVLLGTIFYFPVWLAAALLIVLYAASLFFGILPVLTLLRRTPSEILAKYDI